MWAGDKGITFFLVASSFFLCRQGGNVGFERGESKTFSFTKKSIFLLLYSVPLEKDYQVFNVWSRIFFLKKAWRFFLFFLVLRARTEVWKGKRRGEKEEALLEKPCKLEI